MYPWPFPLPPSRASIGPSSAARVRTDRLLFNVLLAMSFRGINGPSIDWPRSGRDFFSYLSVTPPPRPDFVQFCAPSVRIYIDSPFIPRPIATSRYYAAVFPPIARSVG